MVILFIYLAEHLSEHLSIQRSSVHLSIYLPVHIYLSVYHSIYRSIYLSIYLFLSLPIYLSIYLFIYASIHLSISIHLPPIQSTLHLPVYPHLFFLLFTNHETYPLFINVRFFLPAALDLTPGPLHCALVFASFLCLACDRGGELEEPTPQGCYA